MVEKLSIIVKVQNNFTDMKFYKNNKLLRKNKYWIMHKTLFKYIKKKTRIECS